MRYIDGEIPFFQDRVGDEVKEVCLYPAGIDEFSLAAIVDHFLTSSEPGDILFDPEDPHMQADYTAEEIDLARTGNILQRDAFKKEIVSDIQSAEYVIFRNDRVCTFETTGFRDFETTFRVAQEQVLHPQRTITILDADADKPITYEPYWMYEGATNKGKVLYSLCEALSESPRKIIRIEEPAPQGSKVISAHLLPVYK